MRTTPRYDCQDEQLPWCAEALGGPKNDLPGEGACGVAETADRPLAAPQSAGNWHLAHATSGTVYRPVPLAEIKENVRRRAAQATSDEAHQDTQRHTAARLAHLAEAWVDNAMGLARSCERLRQMQGLLDALRAGHLLQLERRERELVGVGMSDKAGW